MQPFRRKKLTLNGRTLSYVDEGKGPVLLMGHGLLWNADVWAPVIRHLSSSFRCIAPDVWGHGESDPLPVSSQTYPMEKLVEDMEQVVDALGLDTYSVLGLSLGGMWAARMAVDRPAQVERLVLLNTSLGEASPGAKAASLGLLSDLQAEGGFTPEWIEPCLPLYFCASTREAQPELVNQFREVLGTLPSEHIETVCSVGHGAFTRKDFLAHLPKVACPTLVLAGDQDLLHTLEESQRMVQALPDAELLVIPGVGHTPSLEQPEILVQTLVAFLGQPEGTFA